MKKWICTVCGYVHEGEQPPEKCPQCGVPADKFKEQVEGEKEWAFAPAFLHLPEKTVTIISPQVSEMQYHSFPDIMPLRLPGS